MKKFFERDSVLKIFSFVIAIIIWFYIIIVLDPPVVTVIRDIPIRYTQQNALLEQGLSIVDENASSVEIKLEGSRKRLVNINSKNISASVDLSSVSKAGTHTLPVTLAIPYDYLEVVSKKPDMVEVTVDKLVEEKRNIRVKTTGNPEAGYIAGTVELNPSTVLIKGAASVVSQISDVIVTVDVSKRKTDLTDTAEIQFIDSDGRTLQDDDEIFELISADISEVQLKCPIMKLKTVSIKADIDSALAEGETISVQPNTITIYGYEKDIEQIEEIMTQKISIETLRNEKIVNADIMLPENLKLRDNVTFVTVKLSNAE